MSTRAALAAGALAALLVTACGADPTTAAPAGETVPQACLDAIDHTDTLRGITAEVLAVAGTLPPMVARGVEAGVQQDVAAVEQLTAELGTVTTQVNDAQARLEPVLAELEQAQTACRDAAGAGA